MVSVPLKTRCSRCSENRGAELSRCKMIARERLAERARWLPEMLARAVLIPNGSPLSTFRQVRCPSPAVSESTESDSSMSKSFSRHSIS